MSVSFATGVAQRAPAGRRRTGAVLWVLSVVVMLGAATWQRLTGPTYPRRGRTQLASEELRWRLPRSGTSGDPLRVSIAVPEDVGAAGAGAARFTGTIHYRLFPATAPYEAVPMSREDGRLSGHLPTQPPAGKLEYYVTLDSPAGEVRIPAGEPVVMRFKGHVPLWILLPHVLAMFFAMLIGVRAALAAALGRPEARRASWIALLGITLGGMILGPIVQKNAFGAFWTGWPLGTDLTDNKTAAMWIAWIVAVVLLQRRREPRDRSARTAVIVAALVMLAVYVIPHSLRGSQLDYGTAKRGGAAAELER